MTDADKLAAKLRGPDLLSKEKPFFTEDGERRTGKGEYIVVLRPQYEGDRVLRDAAYDVYTREKGQWKPVRPPLIR